jgi:hypothetical protein
MRFRYRSIALAAGLAILGAALPMATVAAAPIVPVTTAVSCDPIDPAACLLPFPNDFFTAADATTDTGLRINILPDAMPRSGSEVTEGGEGKPVDPTEWNRNDGWSPGAMVMTKVNGIDLHQTWSTADRAFSTAGLNEPGYFDYRDQITDINLSTAEDSPLVILDTATGERFPFWSELDLHPNAQDDPATPIDETDSVLILRPARNFDEGHHYVVALRNLKDAAGAIIPAPEPFKSFRDGTTPTLPESPLVAERRADFQSSIFPALTDAGIDISDLYLAWDFTVASERNLAERALTIRDDAFTRILGDPDLSDRKVQGISPAFTIDGIEDRSDGWTDSFGVSHSQAIRRVDGRITVPNYMDRPQQSEGHVRANQAPFDPPAPGSRFYDDPVDADTLPDQNPVEAEVEVPFTCDVVLSQDGVPAGEQIPGLYGHGLLGDRGQLGDLKTPRRNGPFMGCAVDWWGMSTNDLPTVVAIIGDLSLFPSLADRAQQGFLNFMYLGRALVHPDGLAAHPAFQDGDGTAAGDRLIHTTNKTDGTGEPAKLFYDGNSQGGIMGGSLVALSPDIHRGILGVTGMNYSTLLQRSIDWEDLYAIPFYANYQDPIEQQLAFALMQMLWDRGEANGFAAHMTDDPYPNTPKHEVLLQVGYADHQVTNHSAEVEAATIGAPLMEGNAEHWTDPSDDNMFLPVAEYPYEGSGLVYWNSGNATPPNGNLPATHNGDPHSHGRDENASGWQEAHFILTGWLVDVCNGGLYLTRRHPDNGGTASCQQPTWAPGTYESGPQ